MIARVFCAIASVTALVLTTACGGGTSGASVAPPIARGSSSARASITIKIPAAAQGSVRRAYVSRNTQSVSGVIQPASGCATCSAAITIAAGLTPTSPGCNTTAGATTCTLSFALNPGTYSATINTFDGPFLAGAPTGNALSTNGTSPFTVAANQTNTVNLTLQGFVYSFSVVPSDATISSAVPVTGTNLASVGVRDAFLIDGPGTTATFSIIPLDADGNQIIGPGTPQATVTANGSSAYGTWNFNAATNAITITTPSRFPTIEQRLLDISFAWCGSSSSGCSATEAFMMSPLLAVDDVGLSDVAVINLRTKARIATVSSVSVPGCVAFSPTGSLFAASQATNTGAEFAYPYTGSPARQISAGLNQCDHAAYDGSGNLWVTNAPLSGTSSVLRFPPGGIVADIAFTDPNLIWPKAVMPCGGQLLVASAGANKVFTYAKPVTQSTVPTQLSTSAAPEGLAADSNCGFFLAADNGGTEYSINANLQGIRALATYSGTLADIRRSIDGTIEANAIQKLWFPGTGVVSGFNSNADTAFDTLGRLYVSDQGVGKLFEIDPPNFSAPPASINTFSSPSLMATFPSVTY